MAVKIKTADGTRKQDAGKTAMQAFADTLAQLQRKQLNLKTDTMVAYHLGRLQKVDRDKIESGVIPWVGPWHYTTGWIGEALLPEDSSWSMSGSPTGASAMLKIGDEVFEASAHDPFAAWSICLLQAHEKGLLRKTEP